MDRKENEMTIDPLEKALNELFAKLALVAMYWSVYEEQRMTNQRLLDALEIKRAILKNARWIGDCNCVLPEQHCPVCCPEMYEDYREKG